MINVSLFSKLHALFSQQTLRKVPQITLYFWLIKLLTTAMGESTSDYLVHHIDPVLTVILGFIGFTVAIVLQFWTRKYIPWVYWLTVTMVAIFGTMAADAVHIVLGVPYIISTVFFSLMLGILFFVWFRIERTLSIHSIASPRRELFYWLAIIITFALGTAAGDMTAVTFNFGYLDSGLLFGLLFLLPLIVQKLLKGNEVLTFWLAYIFTRPLGASFADWFGRTPDVGGIGFGTGHTSILLTFFIILLVGYLSYRHLFSYNRNDHAKYKN